MIKHVRVNQTGLSQLGLQASSILFPLFSLDLGASLEIERNEYMLPRLGCHLYRMPIIRFSPINKTSETHSTLV